MSLSEICIKRPVFATVLSMVIVVVGLVCFTKLAIRAMPDIDEPIITILSQYNGASSEYIERNITSKIEKVLKTVKNLDSIKSISVAGESEITVYFNIDADIEIALNDVRSKISDIVSMLPEDMKPPSVSKMNRGNNPSIWLSINSDQHDSLELTKIVEDQIRPRIERIESVGTAKIFGGKYYNMIIEPDYVKMYQHQLSPIEIKDAIITQNKNYPSGIIKTGTRDYVVNLNSTLNKAQEFENIILKSDESSILRLASVAKVELTPAETESILRYNGKRSLAIGIIKQSKANEIELSNDVIKLLKEIRDSLPPSIKIETAYDASIPINASIHEVFFTICEALFFVTLVVYLFLGSARATIIPIITIPISLIGTFTIMQFFGFSINNFTLLAMVLAIGLVVDDAIVMLENITRHYKISGNALTASLQASKEIYFAIIAMTITLATVFLPVGFIPGSTGKLLIEFAWTLAFCVLFSGFVALTLTPMMASRIIVMQNDNTKSPIWLTKFSHYLAIIEEKYAYYLSLFLSRKKYLYIGFALAIVIIVICFSFTDKKFMPEEDYGMLNISFTGVDGNSMDKAEKTAIEAEEILKKSNDVLGFFISIWGNGSSAYGFVPLKHWSERKKNQSEIKQILNRQFAKIPAMSIFASGVGGSSGGGSDSSIKFSLQTFGEYEALDILSQEFMKSMRENPIFSNIESDFHKATPTIDITIDREKAYLYGARIDNIGATIKYLIAGQNVGDFMIGNDTYDVILRYNPQMRKDINQLKTILVKSKTGMIALDSVAHVTEKITVKEYNHRNNARSIDISADLNEGVKQQEAIKFIDNIADKILNTNTIFEYLGNIKQMKESQSDILITFALGLVFIYFVLSAQFESFSYSLLILLAVPFSIAGGVLALLIFGNSINMYSSIGLITLIGLITKNSIMIVEFANQLREEGIEVNEAITRASKLRLRPILMTSIATILGSVPLVFASGAGAAARNSIGLVIVGGMSVGTIFTIFVIPALYCSIKSKHAHDIYRH